MKGIIALIQPKLTFFSCFFCALQLLCQKCGKEVQKQYNRDTHACTSMLTHVASMYMIIISYVYMCICVREVRIFIDVCLSRYEMSVQAKGDVNAIEAQMCVSEALSAHTHIHTSKNYIYSYVFVCVGHAIEVLKFCLTRQRSTSPRSAGTKSVKQSVEQLSALQQ